jgi:protein-S-isoprenylcysteine O-methyltransferase Ste14
MSIQKVLWVLFKTGIFTLFVPGMVGVAIPFRILKTTAPPDVVGFPELAYFFFFAGALIYLWCAWDFSVKGMGTPAPIDAPKKLVVNGLYRLVRNPMYIGVFCLILSQAVFYGSRPVLLYLAVVAIFVNLFVLFYEEPHLREVFGEQYLDYCKRVPRWIPRFRATP